MQNKTFSELQKADILDLYDWHLETYNKGFCKSCRGEIERAFNNYKDNHMKKSFQLKGLNPYFRLEKGSKETISNGQMTDELALRFLAIKPTRIELFSQYPDDWEELINPVKPIEPVQVIEPVEPCEECEERKKLEAKKLKELREDYPEIPVEFGQSKADFIDKILTQ